MARRRTKIEKWKDNDEKAFSKTLDEAQMLHSMKENDAARAKYESLLRKLPDPFKDTSSLSRAAMVHGSYGTMLVVMCKYAEAIDQFKLICQLFKTCRQDYDVFDGDFPRPEDELSPLISLAGAFTQAGIYTEALKTLLEGLKVVKKVENPIVKQKSEAKCLFMIGGCYFLQGKLEQAETKLKACLELYGSDSRAEWLHVQQEGDINTLGPLRHSFVEAHHYLGKVLYQRGKLRESEGMFSKALEAAKIFFQEKDALRASIVQVGWRKALVLIELRHFEEALSELQEWLKREIVCCGKEGEDNKPIHLMIAKCQNHLGMPVEAFKSLMKEVNLLNGDEFEATSDRTAACNEELGLAYLFNGQIELALENLKAAAREIERTDLRRDTGRIKTSYAIGLFQSGQAQKALRYLKEAEEVLPTTGGAAVELAEVFYMRAQYHHGLARNGEALKDVEEALRLRDDVLGADHQDTIDGRDLLCAILTALGRTEEVHKQRKKNCTMAQILVKRQARPQSNQDNNQSNSQTSLSLMEDARKLLAGGETRFAQRQFSDARVAFSRCINRLRACANDDAAHGSSGTNSDGCSRQSGQESAELQKMLARALLKRVEVCIASKQQVTADQYAAARRDCEEISSIVLQVTRDHHPAHVESSAAESTRTTAAATTTAAAAAAADIAADIAAAVGLAAAAAAESPGAESAAAAAVADSARTSTLRQKLVRH
mmetsp:Transcript_17716/g.35549  ORF Transcript_17716/g.35549 Transcript_17716/m.35549 type:complete len:716 (-) Transcript_17716:601-2748(-)